MTAKKQERRGVGGRPSYFRGKSASPESGNAGKVPAKRTLNLTWKGNDILDQRRQKLGVSVNEFIEGLIRKHGKTLTIADIESVAD